MNHKSLFFKYVIPSIIAFALSGIYAIVDGYFVGNTIGDAGLSAINIAYPIVALIQALGTGIGMGGAVYYSINAAEKKGKRAEEFIATSWWLLVIVSVISTIIIYSLPPLFGGQIMIWWSTVLARVFSAILAFILIKYCEKGDLQYGIQKI